MYLVILTILVIFYGMHIVLYIMAVYWIGVRKVTEWGWGQ